MRYPADARESALSAPLAHGAIELLLEAAQERPRLRNESIVIIALLLNVGNKAQPCRGCTGCVARRRV